MSILMATRAFFSVNKWAMWLSVAFSAFLAVKVYQRNYDKRLTRRVVVRIKDQIEEQTDERIERVREARRTTADLNDEQLRQLTDKDPNNRGRVQRY